MKKIVISGLALLAFFKIQAQTPKDSTGYKPTKLKIEEFNLVSSYYRQNGDNASVTGGIGSQKLTDIANVIDVTLVKYGKTGKKHTLDVEIGVDHYTSASSDRVDLQANTSASSSDIRVYPSLLYTAEQIDKGRSFAIGVGSSTEYDYQSFNGTAAFIQKTKDRNGEFTARFQAFLDQVKIIKPIELRQGQDDGGTEARNTFAGSLSYAQAINKNLQVSLTADYVQQTGYLSLPFHRVYLNDGTVSQENLPDTRTKIPIGGRLSYFLGDHLIVRAFYRFYTDDWDMQSHTAELELPVKITPFFSLTPFYRYYDQTGIKYFKAYGEHTAAEQYRTSNYDLSPFHSNFYGIGVRMAPENGLFGNPHWAMLEFRVGHYDRSTDLNANIASVNLKYKV